ncbi:CHASE2 domain-containing protein [Rhodoligotrophos defluvii]|uniref:CHASE2 domain-containing protein n=1 Tax=Rhodoligotrophos defluvii TaxID=2561934 RepID=UPI0010C9A9A4|nr:adenylate/guanylate cyclase domain-containing protein [Rhodoligotrophos defluvii]
MAAAKPQLKRRWARLAGLLTLAGLLALTVFRPAVLESSTLALFDSYQRLNPRGVFDSPIRIIDIDEESLRRLGQWPWDRDLIASIVQRLQAAGAAAIAFDIVFAEPDRTSPARVLKRLEQRDPALSIALPDKLPDNDAILAEAFRQAPVVTGVILTGLGDDPPPPAKAGFAHAGADPRSYLADAGGAVANLPIFDEAASGLGFINFQPGYDRVVRSVPLIARYGDQLYPSLALEALRVAQGASTFQIRSTGASREIQMGERAGMVAVRAGDFTIPTSADGEIWIHFTTGPSQNIVPAWQVTEAGLDAEQLRALMEGHIVLIGTSAAGLLDIVATPMSNAVPGVAVQAEIIDQILDGGFLRRPDWAPGAEQTFVLVLGLLLIALLPWFSPASGALIGLAGIALAIGLSWFAFDHEKLLLTPLYAILCVILVYLAVTGVLFLATERERQSIRQAFSLYLAPALVERLAEEPERLKLGGEDRELTIMFSDIRGFTTLSEGLAPQELTKLINDFLTPMSDELLKGGATIDKYIGDAIMAFWNAPLPTDDHATRACATVLKMLKRLDEVRDKIHRPLQIGIGLNTGVCCVGNLGSAQRFNYSAIGDCVNLASRIEGLTKKYGVPILAGQSTVDEARDFAFIEVDQVRVVGKTEPVRIHALLGGPEMKADPAFARMTSAHEEMLGAFRRGCWDKSERLLEATEACAGSYPVAGLLGSYRRRIAQYRSAPPPDWDGITDMESK